ncbi:MAG: CvpA family protein [Treponema sp.]
MNLTVFDMVLLSISLIVIIKVSLRGFIAEFFSMAAFLLGIVIAFRFYRVLAAHINMMGVSAPVMRIIVFFVLFIAVFLAVKIIQLFAASVFQNEVLRSLDHALGFFLGIFEAYVIVLLLLVILEIQPFIDTDTLLSSSVIFRILRPLPVDGRQFLHIIGYL